MPLAAQYAVHAPRAPSRTQWAVDLARRVCLANILKPLLRQYAQTVRPIRTRGFSILSLKQPVQRPAYATLDTVTTRPLKFAVRVLLGNTNFIILMLDVPTAMLVNSLVHMLTLSARCVLPQSTAAQLDVLHAPRVCPMQPLYSMVLNRSHFASATPGIPGMLARVLSVLRVSDPTNPQLTIVRVPSVQLVNSQVSKELHLPRHAKIVRSESTAAYLGVMYALRV